MEASNQTEKKYASIRFSIGDEVLVATPEPNQIAHPLDETQVQALLHKSGFGAHKLDSNLVQQLLDLSKQNANQPLSLEPHTNASVEIHVTPDQLQLSVEFTPAKYGEDISPDELYQALLDMGIPDSNIDQYKLKAIVTSPKPKNEIVAEGKKPIPGEDAYFEILFSGDSEKRPEVAEDGHVNHYETHDYVTVKENAPLMRRHPATEGTPGITIFDEVIPAKAGKDTKFELNKTVRTDLTNPNVLVANKSGHPIAKRNSVTIDESLTLKEASLETGNIHFDGSVLIKGEVKPNVVVEASGDIHVKGLVESARLISGNSITINGGVVSSQLFDEDHQAEFDYGCKLKAENDIHLRYCNSILAEAGGSIFIENYSMHSRLRAKMDVIAGVNNGKGVLLGGEIHSEQNMQANVIGSEAYVRTELYCANILKTRQQFHRSQNRLNRIKKELDMLNLVLDRIKSSGSPDTVGDLVLEKAKRIYREIKELNREHELEKANLSELNIQLQPETLHIIEIHKKVFPNTRIVINDAQTKTAHTHSQCTIRALNGEVHFREPKK